MQLRLIALTTLVWLYTHSRKEHIALSSIKMSAYAIILYFAFPIAVRYRTIFSYFASTARSHILVDPSASCSCSSTSDPGTS